MSRVVDWRTLLTERRIPFIERGANVKRGELNVACAFCGSADPSKHLGINLQTGYWACWRNGEHRGKSPVRLLMRLLNVSHGEALEIAGLDDSYVDPDGFTALVQRMRQRRDSTAEAVAEVPRLRMPQDFLPLAQSGLTRRHWDYLDNRWFDPHQLATEYGVCCGVYDEWKSRAIFPYYEEGELVTWTGRACGPAEIRYRDLEQKARPGYTGPVARVPAKQTLFNHDAMKSGGHWLFLVEGPVDALKLDAYGKEHGCRAVALSTATISAEQLARLDVYAQDFENIGVMMDMASELHVVHSMRMKSQLSGLKKRTHVLRVPHGRKDAGELKAREVHHFCQNVFNYVE